MANATLDSRGVLVPCTSCGKTNRIPYSGLTAPTRCGHCHTALPAPGSSIEAPDSASFDAAIAAATLPVIVDFWAPWCGPCIVMAPELEKAANATAGQWLVVKVNTDRIPELGARFGITSIPTLAVFQNGRETRRAAGARSAADIRAFMSAA